MILRDLSTGNMYAREREMMVVAKRAGYVCVGSDKGCCQTSVIRDRDYTLPHFKKKTRKTKKMLVVSER